MFRLNSVQNKYKVVRIKIDNSSEKSLLLSKNKDEIKLYCDDGVIPGILDLSNHDPAVWDVFDTEMRESLVYPEIVKAGEEENIFVFIPNTNLKELPQKFIYKVNSIPKNPVIIETVHVGYAL